ncbi:MAG: type IV pilus modification protein PilV [Candidatus Dactylopiibacterium carminicum]|uniref:Type IV pilus modification protein PilV n=2 Tax=Candidatus Dactylopiibacterium carminicum TaxID=857335 RepID=A0A272EXA5_9RHOO|nr:type IV pilus modification protein PilV [Candidatus Dactylopiibacterium carminicum]PAS94754.1 MAG: type IV pilus modification protein PilV [Candidatus Dactylopiibacterium carminicum]PAT00223.1 MAG: type IV pilus modification protein PilV [Candidatus Dactylopiibacterium carminicum]
MRDMNATPRPTAQQGSALLEALVSILVFSLGVLGIVALLAKSTQFSVDAEDRTRAAMLANELASQMWENQSTSLDSGVISTWQARVQATGSGLPSASATCSVDSSGLATITVTWKALWRKSDEQANTYSTQVLIP